MGNIEHFFNLNKKELDSTIKDNGYHFNPKNSLNGIYSYIKKSNDKRFEYIVNFKYKGNTLTSFSWDDDLAHGSFIVNDIGNDDYKVNESKTDDSLGIIYLESLDKDLDVIIFKTIPQLQKGMISFHLFKRSVAYPISIKKNSSKKQIEKVEKIDSKKIIEEKKKEGIPNNTKKNIVKNGFNIPIKSNMEEVPGPKTEEDSKPKIYDKNLDYIVFQSSAVVWKKPNEGTSVDKSIWTLTLTPKDFLMKSMNYEKKFKITNVKYDEDFQMQKFELADETTAHTFNLLISYTLETKSYNVIVQSINYKEEYQFQGVVGKEKIFQK
jgi:hypothetical protein